MRCQRAGCAGDDRATATATTAGWRPPPGRRPAPSAAPSARRRRTALRTAAPGPAVRHRAGAAPTASATDVEPATVATRAAPPGRRAGRDPAGAGQRPGDGGDGRSPRWPSTGGSAASATSRSAAAGTATRSHRRASAASCGASVLVRGQALRPATLVAGQYEVVGLPRPRRAGLDLPRPGPQGGRPLGRAEGAASTRGDEDAMAAALAERRFLAEVEHPNIVKIHNFVEHDGDGYIVMEYVNGDQPRGASSRPRRAANGGPTRPAPGRPGDRLLPRDPAGARAPPRPRARCSATSSPTTSSRPRDSLKLIDLGGVYRMDDQTSPVYGTAGYQAPEIARTGPTVAVRPVHRRPHARRAVHRLRRLPGHVPVHRCRRPRTSPLFARFDSLYRFLERATAADPDDRFQSADEMAAQLVGVLREVVATSTGSPAPGAEHLLHRQARRRADAGRLAVAARPARRAPTTRGAAWSSSLGAHGPEALLEAARAVPAGQRRDRPLAGAGADRAGGRSTTRPPCSTRWRPRWPDPTSATDWRVPWYRGPVALAAERQRARQPMLRRRAPAPSRRAGPEAGAWPTPPRRPATPPRPTDLVRHRQPDGPRRSRRRRSGWPASAWPSDDRAGAIEAYGRVPDSSSAHDDGPDRRGGGAARRRRRGRRGHARRPSGRDDRRRARARGRAARPAHGRRARGGVRRAARQRHRARSVDAGRSGIRAPTAASGSASSRPTGRWPATPAPPPSGSPSSTAPTASGRGRGGERRRSLRCPACGSGALADDEFCESCGAAIAGTARRAARPRRGRPRRGWPACQRPRARAPPQRGRLLRRGRRRRAVRRGVRRRLGVRGARRSPPRSPPRRRPVDERRRCAARPTPGPAAGPRSWPTHWPQAAQAVLGVPWLASPDRDAPSCTVVAALWDGVDVTVGWAGDSRAYWLDAAAPPAPDRRPLVGPGAGRGRAADACGRRGRRRAHAITRWLGADAPTQACPRARAAPGDAGQLVLCTDGLWNYLPRAGELARARGGRPATGAPVGGQPVAGPARAGQRRARQRDRRRRRHRPGAQARPARPEERGS